MDDRMADTSMIQNIQEDGFNQGYEKANAEWKKEIEESEFTNILRKFNCSNPNDCMDEIKKNLLKEDEVGK
jgi:hypothetical protein